ncbi:MAG: hypothetical protein NT031_20280 [Planctomycetota bacterium]|nr:hypothetical protein [Planctomycetota bacterium]
MYRPSLAWYRTARLTADNLASSIATTFSVQDARGGVTVRLDAYAASGNSGNALLPLPATSTAQSYRIRHVSLSHSDEPDPFETTALVAWPADVVENSLATLVDPQAYDRMAHLAPIWPAATRRNVFLLGALASLLLVATMFVPDRTARVCALLALTVAITIAAGIALNGQELLFVHDEPGLTAVSARRTTDWSARGRLVPLYAVKSQLTADTTVIGPGDMLQTTIRPDAMRLFVRPAAPR